MRITAILIPAADCEDASILDFPNLSVSTLIGKDGVSIES